MILKSLGLQNFRNYSQKEFIFSPGTTLVVGPNASGKTNLLEAIFLLATGKSFRAELESEMIGYNRQMSNVKCQMSNGDVLELILTRGEINGEKTAKKICKINGVNKRLGDFVGNLRVVYFGPEDLELVTNSPAIRRRYLDMVLSQVDREYARASLSYEKGLRARNKVLEAIRETGAPRTQLYFWDQLLIKNGELITKKREELIEFFNKYQYPISTNKYQCQINTNAQFCLEYDKSVISPGRLEQYKEEEVAAGTTLVGPHRDDIKFKIKNTSDGGRLERSGSDDSSEVNRFRDLSAYGSRGEQRLAILWLKLGELAFVKEKTGELPVLLLDDIFSELDSQRRKVVWSLVGNQQTIITTTDLHLVEPESKEKMNIINLGI